MRTNEYFRKKSILIAAYVAMLVIAYIVCTLEAPRAPLTNEVETMTVTTCTTTTTTTTSTCTTTTTVLSTTVTTTTETTTTTTTTYDFKSRLIDYGYFTGTYYHGQYYNPCPGGSGRMLEDCTPKSDEIKGSVACRRIQEEYDYWVNGRTKVYLEIVENPEMNGWYWVDDACESYSVVDFYFIDYDDCPWHGGLSRTVHLWMEVS